MSTLNRGVPHFVIHPDRRSQIPSSRSNQPNFYTSCSKRYILRQPTSVLHKNLTRRCAGIFDLPAEGLRNLTVARRALLVYPSFFLLHPVFSQHGSSR